MTERVQVEPSEIKVGDLIEVEETPEGGSGATLIRRDVVTGVEGGGVTTTAYTFSRYYDKQVNRVYYRLPKPAPEEPKALGAVVEDSDGDWWVRGSGVWHLDGAVSNWLSLLENYGPVTVKHDGYTA